MNIARLVFSPLRLTAVLVVAAYFTVHSAAALKYVDGSAPGPIHDGTSWNNAWTNVTAMTGLNAGDIVYISGGPHGSTQTYSFADSFNNLSGYAQGTTGSPITYKIGQDAAHNGTAIFNQTSKGSGYGFFIYGASNVIFSGDAADGSKHFALGGTFEGLVVLQGTDANVRLSYFELGTLPYIGTINPANHVEIDNINIKVGKYAAADHALYANFAGSTWDDNKIHHCTVQLPYNPTNSNFGPDGFQLVGTGFSFYNNTLTTYVDNTLTTTQHMDGYQGTSGTYVKIYNNVITNMTNYGIYAEGIFGVFNHLRIYNNVISVTDPVFGTHSSGGIVVEQKIAGTMNDIVVANNTIVDLQPPGSRALTILSDGFGSFTNTVIANNLLVDSAPVEQDGGAPAATNSVSVSAVTAPIYFTRYVKYGGAANDFHLTALAATLLNKGTNVSAYIGALDLSNLTFASPPSIGAYEYSGNVVTLPPSNAKIGVALQ